MTHLTSNSRGNRLMGRLYTVLLLLVAFAFLFMTVASLATASGPFSGGQSSQSVQVGSPPVPQAGTQAQAVQTQGNPNQAPPPWWKTGASGGAGGAGGGVGGGPGGAGGAGGGF